MKTLFRILLVLLAFTASEVFAQKHRKSVGKKLSGYVITRQGAYLQGKIKVQNQYNSQYQVVFFDESDKKQKLVPFEIKEYGFKINKDSVKYTQVRYQGNYVWVLQENNDFVKLYSYYAPLSDVENPVQISTAQLQQYWLVQKADFGVVSFDWGRFYEQAAEYFEDYPQLSKDIWQKKYKRNQVPEIVKIYNVWHQQQKN